MQSTYFTSFKHYTKCYIMTKIMFIKKCNDKYARSHNIWMYQKKICTAFFWEIFHLRHDCGIEVVAENKMVSERAIDVVICRQPFFSPVVQTRASITGYLHPLYSNPWYHECFGRRFHIHIIRDRYLKNRASKNLIHGLTTYKISATPGFKGFSGQATSAHSIAMRPCICRGIPSPPKELLFRDGIVVRPRIVGGHFSMKCTRYSNMVALKIPILSCL